MGPDPRTSRSSLSLYLSEIRALPALTREEEALLGQRISRGGREAQQELVVSNLGFVLKVASEYQNMGLPFEDLVNEGNLGLLRAASRYDHRRGVKFVTYASWWVRKSILKALSEQGAMIRVPAYQKRKQSRLRAEHEAARARHGHLASDPPCRECGPEAIATMNPKWVSLDEESSPGSRSRLVESLIDRMAVDPEREIIRREDLGHLGSGMSSLSAKERAVIAKRFGLWGAPASTLKAIGAAMGLSRERVRQIETVATNKLRARLRSAGVLSAAASSRPRRSYRTPHSLHAGPE